MREVAAQVRLIAEAGLGRCQAWRHSVDAAVRAVSRANLDLVGMAVYGPRGAVDKIFKGARMHP